MANQQVASQAQIQQQLIQANAYARMAIQQQAVEMRQPIFSQTIADPAAYPVVTVPIRPVGLLIALAVRVKATVTAVTGGATVASQMFGPANLIKQFEFSDLENNQRIITPGYHLALLDAVKRRRPRGGAFVAATGLSDVVSFGSNYLVNANESAVQAGDADKDWIYNYWVPVAYSKDDLRGAIYANTTNAQMQLKLTLAQNVTSFAAAATGDLTGIVGTGDAAATLTNFEISVKQIYYDQLPTDGTGRVLLPVVDMSHVYELKTITQTGMAANTDFPVDYGNFRDFLSTFAIYYGGHAMVAGTDVNKFKLMSANMTNIWDDTPSDNALAVREHLGLDLPSSVYYFGSRQKPISTRQYGNMQLVLNALTVTDATAKLTLCYEDFAIKNVVAQASAIGS